MHRHGGDIETYAAIAGLPRDEIADFSANVNPCGYPEWLRRHVERHLHELSAYPDPESKAVRKAIAAHYDVPYESAIAANGAAEILSLLVPARAMNLGALGDDTSELLTRSETAGMPAPRGAGSTGNSGDCAHSEPSAMLPEGWSRLRQRGAVIATPAYGGYATSCRRWGCPVSEVGAFAPWTAAEGTAAKTGQAQADNLHQLQSALEVARRKASSAETGARGPAALCFVGRPNNPTGHCLSLASLEKLIESNPQTLFCIDESFAWCIESFESTAQLVDRGNVIVVVSMTKAYAVPGLRIGYALGPPEIAELLRRLLPTWSVNRPAQLVAPRLLGDSEYLARSRRYLAEMRGLLVEGLRSFGGVVYSSEVNYLLWRLPPPWTGQKLFEQLITQGMAVRRCDNFTGLDDSFVRLAVRSETENEKLLAALRKIMDISGLSGPFASSGASRSSYGAPPSSPTGGPAATSAAWATPTTSATPAISAASACPGTRQSGANRRKAAPSRASRPAETPAIMLQGTSSDAGKSVLAVALCRLLSDAGYRVAPFKAQNMSPFTVTLLEGGEISCAQALQAAACRRSPDIRMNPVVLKPGGDKTPSSEAASHGDATGRGAALLVNGRPLGPVSAQGYEERKPELRRTVQKAYDSLADEADIVVLEGAGSPGEVNLKKNDIVNMSMARYANAAVFLVGDIDRGGVYASFVGTMEVLSEWERRLVAGFLVNKFRGDPSLLSEAHAWMVEHAGRDVLGVVPYLPNHGLPAEDTLSHRADGRDLTRSTGTPPGRTVADFCRGGDSGDEQPELDRPIDRFARHVGKHIDLERIFAAAGGS